MMDKNKMSTNKQNLYHEPNVILELKIYNIWKEEWKGRWVRGETGLPNQWSDKNQQIFSPKATLKLSTMINYWTLEIGQSYTKN